MGHESRDLRTHGRSAARVLGIALAFLVLFGGATRAFDVNCVTPFAISCHCNSGDCVATLKVTCRSGCTDPGCTCIVDLPIACFPPGGAIQIGGSRTVVSCTSCEIVSASVCSITLFLGPKPNALGQDCNTDPAAFTWCTVNTCPSDGGPGSFVFACIQP